MTICPENHFKELMELHQKYVDASCAKNESIEKISDELLYEALDCPGTLLNLDKDYDFIQDSLCKALKLSSSAKAGHIIHREELVAHIYDIWKRLDTACQHKASHEWVNY